MSSQVPLDYIWSIAIYSGASPLGLTPHPGAALPALTARDVSDIDALFVADPFMCQHGGEWLMFFEVWNSTLGRGEIGLARSRDLCAWAYDRIVLRAPHHLSYPLLVEWEGEIWLVPETRQAGEVALYRAMDFPYGWRRERTLLRGDYADATPFQSAGRWWMFALEGTDTLTLHHARQLGDDWQPHRLHPLRAGDKSRTRPGGRLVSDAGRLFRLTQDGVPLYGSRLRAMEITRLTEGEYVETECPESPLLKAALRGWNSIAMHHLDAHCLTPGKLAQPGAPESPPRWIGCVDGAAPRLRAPSEVRG
jgi:hypothetical protein